jgi:hypothetical protein
MAAQDQDLSEFFPADVSIPVVVADGSEILGVFTDDSIADENGSPHLTVMTIDVREHDMTQGTKLSLVRPVTGQRATYTIAGRQHDGTGLSDLVLEAD